METEEAGSTTGYFPCVVPSYENTSSHHSAAKSMIILFVSLFLFKTAVNIFFFQPARKAEPAEQNNEGLRFQTRRIIWSSSLRFYQEKDKKKRKSQTQPLHSAPKGSVRLVFPKSKQLVSSFAIKEISRSCSSDREPKKRVRMLLG